MIELVAIAIVLAVLGSILVYYARTGVPPVPASREEIDAVIELLREAKLPPKAKIYELGSGFGVLAIAIARNFPDAIVEGIELSPIPYLFSKLRGRAQKNLRFRRADFLQQNLDDAAAITTYLMIKPMPRVAAHLDRTLKPGTPAIAVGFWFRDRRPAKTLRDSVALYYWSQHAV